jgi:butyrate kinase
MRILVINPGNVSTKISLYTNEKEEWKEVIEYDVNTIKKFSSPMDQLTMRLQDIRKILETHDLSNVDAVVGRGGLFKPLLSGVYRANNSMIEDIKNGKMTGKHMSNIGAILAKEIGDSFDVPSFIVDPVSVDEFEDVARISGIPEIERVALQHTLNIRRTARLGAKKLGVNFENANFVVAHLGSGISVCPLKNGKIIDANNAIQEGPFSPERAGGVPANTLVDICFSGNYEKKWIKKRLVGQGGFVAYLGTNDLRKVEEKINAGDRKSKLVFDAMIYQIAKEIGGMATVLEGKVDAILLTGGLAYSKMLIDNLIERISFIGPILIFPGENEMESLAEGALRVLTGKEKEKEYV